MQAKIGQEQIATGEHFFSVHATHDHPVLQSSVEKGTTRRSAVRWVPGSAARSGGRIFCRKVLPESFGKHGLGRKWLQVDGGGKQAEWC